MRLKRKAGSDYKILIDCGVAVATKGATETMKNVMNDILSATEGRIDVLAVTHEHWDHISGFSQAKAEFGRLKVGEVWLAWTEDEKDELARTLRKERAHALQALSDSASRLMLSGADELAQDILNVSGHFGAAGEKTKDAFDGAKAKVKQGQSPRYWRPKDPPLQVDELEARFYALGPPHDAKAIRKVRPSKRDPETYELLLDGRGVFPLHVKLALDGREEGAPFARIITIPLKKAKAEEFFKDHYWATKNEDWRRIDGDWLAAADDLALALQNATNNTSLVLAIELPEGDVLLFVGDAQVGNWLSWQELRWKVGNKEVTGPDLLARTIFYKVGHHGSHNATLRDKGLEQMTRLRTAVVPVDHQVALKMSWGEMPLESLLEALDEKTGGRTLRTDIAPTSPIDGVTVAPLYYEIEI